MAGISPQVYVCHSGSSPVFDSYADSENGREWTGLFANMHATVLTSSSSSG